MIVYKPWGFVVAVNEAHQNMYLPAKEYYSQTIKHRTIQTLLGAA